MLLQSFDNYHQEKMRQKQARLRYLKQQQEQLEQTILAEKEKAFGEAFARAEHDFTRKNQAFIEDVEQFNQSQITQLSQTLEDSVTQQANHYASLLSNILYHFMPMIAEHYLLDEFSNLLKILLQTCDTRKIIVVAHSQTIDLLTDKIHLESRRISFSSQNNLEVGKIMLQYEGGLSEMSQQDITQQMIETITTMLGQTHDEN